jgi:two-component sensor histidine kinase
MKRNASASKSELDLLVSSDWGEVGRVNEAVAEFLESCGLPPETVSQCTMVVCELVENGIKYGCFDKDRSTVRVITRVSRGSISVQVVNPVGSRSQVYLKELDRTIQWVRGFQAPFEAYIARMKAISREPLEADKSGLGLVRITYEGRAVLDFFLDENETLSVSAVSDTMG